MYRKFATITGMSKPVEISDWEAAHAVGILVRTARLYQADLRIVGDGHSTMFQLSPDAVARMLTAVDRADGRAVYPNYGRQSDPGNRHSLHSEAFTLASSLLSSGAFAAAASVLVAYFRQRKAHLKFKITRRDGTEVEVDVTHIQYPHDLVQHVLEAFVPRSTPPDPSAAAGDDAARPGPGG
jgi:hypothetical protein